MGAKPDRITLEATLEPQGKEWDVTIIGAGGPNSLVEYGGRKFVRSKNNALYSVEALKNSVKAWDNIKVFDDHQTDEEYERRMGMRSPLNEWVGVITSPWWDDKTNRLRAKLKIVETRLAEKLKNAWDAGVLGAIGLSISTQPEWGDRVLHEGRQFSIIEGFRNILSVDIVGNPAAGGAFERLLASHHEETNMEEQNFLTAEQAEQLVSKAVADALAAKAKEAEQDIEEMSDDEALAALDDKQLTEAKLAKAKAQRETEKLQREAAIARTQLMLTQKLGKANLPPKFQEAVEYRFKNTVASAEEIDEFIKIQREAYASMDPSGKVRAGDSGIKVGLVDEERLELEIGRLMMGNTDFKALEHNDNELVKERVTESTAYKAWVNAGKPALPRYNRVSSLLYDYFGGDPLLDPRVLEATTTSSLTTAVKNTVNIMTANAYSVREMWWEPIVRYMEVDTIDDSTLARVFGVDSLSTVNEGAAYTELDLADEEETASFVKRGNYIGVTLETLMKDKIGDIRRIPEKLANAWYNTQSDLVSGVFTVNSAAGPVLSDTGALFNATATSTPGGHKNLLTAALSHAGYAAARLEMRKQTDQPLGAGRKLLIEPRFLLVPVDLETTALELRNSELYPGADFDSAGAGAQTQNVFRGRFDVITVPTWTDTNNWALVADPQMWPAIWLIYPRGQRTPQIFSAENETSGAMFTNDVMRFKVRLMTYRFSSTYDCAPVSDFRPLHKSNV